MRYIVLIAVTVIVLLQVTGSIPKDSVGGSLVIAPVFLAGALAIAIHEAWTRKRGVLGWIVNVVVAFVGLFLFAPIGGMIVALLLAPVTTGRSLMESGDPVMSVALAAAMAVTLLSAWGAIQIVNWWRAT